MLISSTPFFQPRAVASPPSQDLMRKFNSLKHAWLSLCREPVNLEPFTWSYLGQKADSPGQHSSSSSSSLGVCALQKLGVICLEQDRVKALFVTEVCRVLENIVLLTASKLSKWPNECSTNYRCGPTNSSSVTQIVDLCKKETVRKRLHLSLLQMHSLRHVLYLVDG